MAGKAKKSAAAPAAAPAGNGDAGESLGGYKVLADLGRENFSAMLRANAALSEGLEAIGKEVIFYARSSFERAAEQTAALLAAKTFEDVVQLNTEFARGSLERLLERSAKLSEMGVRLASETLAPLGDRVEVAFQKLGRGPAA